MGRLSKGILCVLVAMGGLEACSRPTTVLDTCAKIGSVEQQEGNSVQFTVTFTGCTTGGTFSYSTIPDNATEDADFVRLTGTLHFGVGDTAPRNITLEVKQDNEKEGNERVWIGGCIDKIVVRENRYGLDAAGMITIVDDDTPAAAKVAMILGTPSPTTTIPDGYGCGR